MNNASKIILILFIGLAIWWGYDNFYAKNNNVAQKITQETEITTPEKELPSEEEQQQEIVVKDIYIYFLTTDSSGNQYLKPVKRNLPEDKNKLTFAIEELMQGPNQTENELGIYSEVPESAKIINITNENDKIIINLTESFGTGGGSDSTYSRMRQLIKTILANTDKPTYLYLNGKQADIIGGEGITVTQPLSEKSLDE